MQFKHPEVLYFLFVLIIPIIVHLFQLRRFKKTYFTNVKLLKELQQQTRKSSSLKKWLLLATRLLLLAALIFAFAQPFFTAKDAKAKENELIILLDNSFSMQAKGKKGELLKRSIQDVLESLPDNQQFSLLTPTQSFWDTDKKTIQSDLLNLNYSAYPFNLDELLIKTEAQKPSTNKDYIIITDGLVQNTEKIEQLSKDNTFVVLSNAENTSNCSIENVTLNPSVSAFYEISITLKSFGETKPNIPLTITDGTSSIAKTQVNFENNQAVITLNIPKKAFHGKVSIEDGSLPYDNDYYFSIWEPTKNAVLAIGETSKNEFLKRIVTSDEFEFKSSEVKQLDYNTLEKQQVVILNELDEIPQSLSTTLQTFYQNGGTVVLIPSKKNSIANLNLALQKWSSLSFSDSFSTEKEITKIHFEHPLYQDVFEKKISNFQYPKVNAGFELKGNAFPILSFADGTPFLASTANALGNLYVFSAAINKQNSNFQNSPLIVPTFYNIVATKRNQTLAAYTISDNKPIIVDALLTKDEVVTIKNDTYSFIPIQQITNDKVKLSFGDYPEVAGNYSVYQKDKAITDLSFNYPRNESNLALQPNPVFDNFEPIHSISEAVDSLQENRTDTLLWKWFLAATLLFLILELLIQKFVK